MYVWRVPGATTRRDVVRLTSYLPFAVEEVDAEVLAKVFRKAAGSNRVLSRSQFADALQRLSQFGAAQRLAHTAFADRLFELFDTKKNGHLDIEEFILGIAPLCKNDVDAKLELAFQAYDTQGTGYISKEEMHDWFQRSYLAGFKAIRAIHSEGMEHVSEWDIEKHAFNLATTFADKAFEHADIGRDGMLSKDEFKRYARENPRVTAVLNGCTLEIDLAIPL